MSEDELRAWLAVVVRRVNRRLAAILAAPGPAPELAAAMRDAALAGGKRLRPALLLAAAEPTTTARTDDDDVDEADGADDGDGENAVALAAACAVELAHCYSLTHDDLPAMDDAATRRGRPSCHRAHGEARAILAGDCLQSLAFQILADHLPVAVSPLARALGAEGMGGGQSLDLDNRAGDEAGLARVHELKTGRLFRCALRLGLLCRPPSDDDNEAADEAAKAEARALDEFGQAFGLLFQIRDDLRGEKEDRENGRQTYVTLLGRAVAQQRAEAARDRALRALNGSHPKLAALTAMVFAA